MSQWVVFRSAEITPRFSLPLSFTSYRGICTCPLQFAFSRDNSYPPKISPRARMGTAFHSALAYLASSKELSTMDIIDKFLEELTSQRAEAMANYRERHLPWPQDLREAMENVLAIRHTSSRHSPSISMHRTEKILVSSDGLLMGRPDEVITVSGSLVVVDYKTGAPRDEDMSYYEEQIHFYAGLWADIYGVMPVAGRVEFLLDRSRHEFATDEKQSALLLSQARELARALQEERINFRAQTGEHCRWCDYRPWCEEYWLVLQPEVKESTDVQGIVCPDHRSDSAAFCLRSSEAHITIVNKGAEPLPGWAPGSDIRCIDLSCQRNILFYTRYSEVFQVIGENQPSRETN